MLRDDEWRQWSDREISRQCHVSNNFVSTLRKLLSSDDSKNPKKSLETDDSENKERVYTNKHGTITTMSTANTGHKNSMQDCMINLITLLAFSGAIINLIIL